MDNRFPKHHFKEEEASWETQRLFFYVKEYSSYFRDMVFTKGTIPYKKLTILTSNEADKLSYFHCERKAIDFELEDCIYRTKRIEHGYSGKFSRSEFSLTLAVSYFPAVPSLTEEQKRQRKISILHEMIHMYEFVLDSYECSSLYREILVDYLYGSLSVQIDNLDDIIDQKLTLICQKRFQEQYGKHDKLFLLKSIDLDLKIGEKIGSVLYY